MRFKKAAQIIAIFLTISALESGGPAQTSPASPLSPPSAEPAQIVHFLSQTITWYRQRAVEQQLATEPSDLTFFDENRRVADQVVPLAFDYARAQAEQRAKQRTLQPSSANNGQTVGLTRLVQQAEQQIQDTETELEGARAKLGSASPGKKKALAAQAAELESELGLLQARRDALQTMAEFMSSSQSGTGGMGLRAQIEELARSVPTTLSRPAGTNQGEISAQTVASPNNAVSKKPQPSGIWGLTADLIQLSGKKHSLEDEIGATQELSSSAQGLRAPLVGYLQNLVHQGDRLFAAADTAAAAQLVEEKKQLDALTAQFKQNSADLLPLSKILVLVDIYQRTLNSWRESVTDEIHEELRQLLLRVGLLLALIVVILVIGEVWRKTTFRYVRDVRRRYQFLLLRRVVMWLAVGVIILLTFASQLGSAVTFAGLITAGVAVALQNVILSAVAYFFLIGKYGIRVGDRVQIAGVAGEVVDIGLLRIHLMELSGPGDGQPTGRIVAFSNSIVFQPTAGVFKQIPGTNFIWHEVKLTLAADTDYHAAKERINHSVDRALAESREGLEAQRLMMERNLTVSPAELRAKIRLHYTASGIEVSVRFPVELEKASDMDDLLMKELMSAFEREPKLKLVSAEMPATVANS
ncbi:MAG: mechanosensitive ion channel family protein [Acidobacteria bacterium]|nr:mechanosensitive ion channel family protein [Acidobacteriota bacterium]